MITDFFQDLTNGSYQTGGLAFNNWVLKEQRTHLKNAIILSHEDARRQQGIRIMNAIKKMHEEERTSDSEDTGQNASPKATKRQASRLATSPKIHQRSPK